jgi:hypothetical protein
MEQQDEFLFADGPASQLELPDPRSNFYRDVSETWQLPVGQFVQVGLRDHSWSDLQGRLELERAPSLPLDPREPLALRIGQIGFSSRQLTAWSLV